TVEMVIPILAKQRIFPAAANQRVVVFAAEQLVVSASSNQGVIPLSAEGISRNRGIVAEIVVALVAVELDFADRWCAEMGRVHTIFIDDDLGGIEHDATERR